MLFARHRWRANDTRVTGPCNGSYWRWRQLRSRLYCRSSPKPFRRRLCPSGLLRGLVHCHRTWRLSAYSYAWGSRTTEDLVTFILVDTIYLLKKNWERIMDVKGYYYVGLRQVLVPGLSVAEAVGRLHPLPYLHPPILPPLLLITSTPPVP